MATSFLSNTLLTQMETPIELAIYYGGGKVATWTFDIPPSSVQYQEPLRANIQQALAAPYADRYNAALPTIIVEWSTSTGAGAVRAKSQDPDGYTHFMRLVVQMIRGYYTQTASDVTGAWTMHWYDYPHQQFASVIPLSNDWTHATPENMALSSELTFQVLQWLTVPHAAGRSYTQSALVDHPASFVQTTAQSLLTTATDLGGYLNPNALTNTQQNIWAASPYQATWETADYQEWFTQQPLGSPLTQAVLAFATQTLPGIATPIVLTPAIPYQTPLSHIQAAQKTVQSLKTQVAALSTPTPWVQGFLDQASIQLTALPIAPALFIA